MLWLGITKICNRVEKVAEKMYSGLFDKKNLQIIKGGWHFSFLQTPDQILEKIKSFSHGEFNSEDIDKKKIEAKIFDNIDIFNRGNVLKKINLDETFPSFILENKNKFSEWII